MYSFSDSRSGETGAQVPDARHTFLATTITPDVPRSSRWTMPGRTAPPMPLRFGHVMQQRVDQRARRMSGARMHDHPRRLVQHGNVAILIKDIERTGSPPDATPRQRNVDFDVVAFVATVFALIATAPRTRMQPSAISAGSCDRSGPRAFGHEHAVQRLSVRISAGTSISKGTVSLLKGSSVRQRTDAASSLCSGSRRVSRDSQEQHERPERTEDQRI
jgi:hypothetical protein